MAGIKFKMLQCSVQLLPHLHLFPALPPRTHDREAGLSPLC